MKFKGKIEPADTTVIGSIIKNLETHKDWCDECAGAEAMVQMCKRGKKYIRELNTYINACFRFPLMTVTTKTREG